MTQAANPEGASLILGVDEPTKAAAVLGQADPHDSDGTDGEEGDGTDGADTDGTDGADTDGTDGADTDGVDGNEPAKPAQTV